MLTIENIHKMVDRKIPIQSPHWTSRVKDVYWMNNNTYVFVLQIHSTFLVDSKEIRIILDRKPPRGVYFEERYWELSWEIGAHTNRFETKLVSSKVLRDMNLFGMELGNFLDIIIHSYII
jgi:hypothetical protein